MFNFKKEFLELAINNYERVYLHAIPHANLIIGDRGLVGDEAKVGIVLSIGVTTASDLKFEDTKISVRLRFAGKWEYVEIPYDCIDAVLNDLQKPDFVTNFTLILTDTTATKPTVEKLNGKVLKVDFTKKK